jgi:uncharacterized protein
MLVRSGQVRYSASDLIAFLECDHLAWLERERAFGRIESPAEPADPMAELVARKGLAHERAHFAKLEAKGARITRISGDASEREAAAAATIEAMRRGDPVIYQAVFERDGWLGIADFLQRVERPSALGVWSYEVADTKLARRTKPYYLIQLSLYSEFVAAIQGNPPEKMHVLLDRDEPESFACREYVAYLRALRAEFLRFVARNGDASTYPLPVEHCAICRWTAACEDRWQRDDHLCGVADIRRKQIRRLESSGIKTMAALAELEPDRRVPKLAATTLATLRAQARLQVAQRSSGSPSYELLPPLAGRGFALLPPPDDADVFFDLEGDPFVDRDGREYLFGIDVHDASGKPSYRALWGHDSAGERKAFEDFVDFVTERRRRAPGLHVYHYAQYEPTALKRLAGRYGTRENELDDLLRGDVFVDLYRVVRQSMRASLPGYSIKEIEHLYTGAREAAVTSGTDSIAAYELWLDSRKDEQLAEIERYNAEDCRSTRLLRDWLLDRRRESETRFGPAIASTLPVPKPKSDDRLQDEAERNELFARLTASLDADPEALTGVERARWLLAQLIDYHQREERPWWWMFFARLAMSADELIDDSESIGGLEPDPAVPPVMVKRSVEHAFRFPAQELKLSRGAGVVDVATGEDAGTITAIDSREGTLTLKRGPKLAGVALPKAIIPGDFYNTTVLRKAIRRVAKDAIGRGLGSDSRYRALVDLLQRELPRVRGIFPGTSLQPGHMDFDMAWPVVRELDRSTIVIQGPPGSGKTYLGARLIVALMKEGRSVGVTALSHRAIHNLLHEVEAVAEQQDFPFRGLKKRSGDGGDDDESVFRSTLASPHIQNIGENPDRLPSGVLLLAGTAWLFSREAMDQTIDTLFVDEAGQISLADAIAVGTAARNLVFLGDPQQLPQVSQGTHPSGAGVSVLEHVLMEHDTIPPERGLFLDRTYRMHPDVCRFISELSYEGRLESAPDRERQRVDSPGASGTGLRYLPVAHEGNGQRSEEEAKVIRREVELLLEGTFTDHIGQRRPLGLQDILVVTPYNAQVQAISAVLPPNAQVGTVDKFQGRQAAVVIFSMATSSGDDLPRDLEFLFSRNRLNVAISRAKALSVLVASPRLLQIRCRSEAQMRLVNGLCRLVEFAQPNE